MPEVHLCVGKRPWEGRSVKMPVHAAGMRKEPPYEKCQLLGVIQGVRILTISVPTPNGLPPKTIRADSPPDEPPEVTFLFSGFTVLPNTLLTDSACLT